MDSAEEVQAEEDEVGLGAVDWEGPGLGVVDSEAAGLEEGEAGAAGSEAGGLEVGGSEVGDSEVGGWEAEAVATGAKSRPGCRLPVSRTLRGRRPGKGWRNWRELRLPGPSGKSAAGGAKGG